MTSAFNIAPPGYPADLRLIPKEEVEAPFGTAKLRPATNDISDIARLFREQREDALKLAGENAARHWRGE